MDIMQYTFSCPMDGCDYTAATEAEDENSAKAELFSLAKEHGKNTHPENSFTDEQVEEIVEKNMQRS